MIIVSGNGLVHVWHKDITFNAHLLSMVSSLRMHKGVARPIWILSHGVSKFGFNVHGHTIGHISHGDTTKKDEILQTPIQMYNHTWYTHYVDVTMTALVSQITSLTIVYSTVYSGADQRKHQSSASLAFVQEIHRGPVNSPHKGPVTRKMLPFDDVIMWPILQKVRPLTVNDIRAIT